MITFQPIVMMFPLQGVGRITLAHPAHLNALHGDAIDEHLVTE
jgi:hypothetical protein